MAEPEIHRNDSLNRFEVNVEGAMSVLTFRRSPGAVTFIHTEVPPQLEGHGIASRLVKAALEFAASRNLKVRPQCPFVARYIATHQEYQSLLEENSGL